MEYSPGELVKRYVELRAEKQVMEARHEEELKPIKEGLDTLGAVLLEYLNRNDLQNFKTEYGTTYKSRVMTVRTTDKNALVEFANEQGCSDMLDIKANKTGLEIFMQQNPELVVPGVEIDYRINLNVRKR